MLVNSLLFLFADLDLLLLFLALLIFRRWRIGILLLHLNRCPFCKVNTDFAVFIFGLAAVSIFILLSFDWRLQDRNGHSLMWCFKSFLFGNHRLLFIVWFFVNALLAVRLLSIRLKNLRLKDNLWSLIFRL